MKVLVCGGREWFDWKTLERRLLELPAETTIIEGGAEGADAFARMFAQGRKWPYMEFKANWKAYGRSAGPIRNRKMLDEKPDLVLAFHNDYEHSKGTKDCVEEAKRRGIPVEVICSTTD